MSHDCVMYMHDKCVIFLNLKSLNVYNYDSCIKMNYDSCIKMALESVRDHEMVLESIKISRKANICADGQQIGG